MLRTLLPCFLFVLYLNGLSQINKWTEGKANAWYEKQPWLVGCNFIPSTAINELEMWQAETFDSATIDKELGWAEGIGFNTVRVYLHNLVWEHDARGFKERINQYLQIAEKHHIKTIFVLFDDCWNDNPKIGKQPDPIPGVHNSGWMQAPGPDRVVDSSTWKPLEGYTKDILNSFGKDKRVLMWDLYNEPGNSGMLNESLPLLKTVFSWAAEVRPTQPVTAATWNHSKDFDDLNAFQLANSDVISFHNYQDAASLEAEIIKLKELGRPLICTEYMARTNNSRFETHLPIFKKYNVAAINWGLVSGKTNTIFPWGSKEGSPEPKTWFHDIFRKDGTPYRSSEVDFIRSLTKVISKKK
ncbi:MAG: cellulase family glycosylhydrolase [Cyclobacteriaceae bacterium]